MEGGALVISDLFYHLLLVKAFWFEDLTSIYDLDSQLEVIRRFSGQPFKTAMPIGVTPLALLVWFPFAYIATVSPVLASSLWMSLSLSVYLVFVIEIFFLLREESSAVAYMHLILCGLATSSTTFMQALILGQTSILATGVLLCITHRIYLTKRVGLPAPGVGWISIALFFLALKPPYLALGIFLLFAFGIVSSTVRGLGVLVLLLTLLTPLLGVNWPLDYLRQLSVYTSEVEVPEYALAIVPETMILFQSAFGAILGADNSYLLSTLACLAGGIVATICLVVSNSRLSEKLPCISAYRVFILICATYLLFAPYAGAYEDLLILSALGGFAVFANRDDKAVIDGVWMIPLVIVIFNQRHSFLQSLEMPLWIYWCLKALMFSFLLCATSRKSEVSRAVG